MDRCAQVLDGYVHDCDSYDSWKLHCQRNFTVNLCQTHDQPTTQKIKCVYVATLQACTLMEKTNASTAIADAGDLNHETSLNQH